LEEPFPLTEVLGERRLVVFWLLGGLDKSRLRARGAGGQRRRGAQGQVVRGAAQGGLGDAAGRGGAANAARDGGAPAPAPRPAALPSSVLLAFGFGPRIKLTFAAMLIYTNRNAPVS